MRQAAAAFALALALLAAPPAQARRALTPPAPELPENAVWINSLPFSLSQLRERRVVLLAFINSANINSLRALKALEAWDRAWSLKGLMVIGVHAPAFDYQKDPAVVKRALRHYGVEFPVVLDNDGRISRAYANDGWPAFFLVDGEGSIVYDHVGEDRYRELESEIRQAVSELPDYGELDDPPIAKDAPLTDCGKATPELAVSSSAVQPADEDAPASRVVVLSGPEGRLKSTGKWTMTADGAVLAQANKSHEASIRTFYRGAQALAALTTGPRAKSRFFVKQDGLWLHSLNAGSDVHFDDDGRSYVIVDAPRLYELAANPSDDPHELEILPAEKGDAVRQLSFADRCLPLRP